MWKITLVALLLPVLVASVPFRSCSLGNPPTSVQIEGCTTFPCPMIRTQFVVTTSTFTNPITTSGLTTNVNFRSSVGSGSYILQPDQENACENLISGACPLNTNSVATHRLNLFIPDTLFPGFDITLEIFLRNAQGGIVNCYEADFRIF